MSMWKNWVDGGARLAVTPERGSKTTLFVREMGPADGPVTLFLHGFPTHSLDWAKIADALPGRRLIMPDLLGFGASDKPRERYSYPRQADLILAMLAQKGVGGAITIVAHDYSVTLLQEFLAREAEGALPFAIERGVFLNGGVYGALHRPVLTQKLLLTPLVGPVLATQMSARSLKSALDKLAGPDLPWSAEDVAAHFEGIAASGGRHRLPALLHYIADRKRYGARWEGAMERAIEKLSFIWGEGDPVSGAHMIARVRERLPTARIVSYADVGHYPQWEAPERVGPAIAQFLGG